VLPNKIFEGKGVCNTPTSTPKNIKQHIKPTPNDMTDENDLPPYLVRVALHPIIYNLIGKR
jgi:hypothetical protein